MAGQNLEIPKILPKLSDYELEYLVGRAALGEKKIENTVLYNLIKKLTDKAFPTYEDEYDKRWHFFYVPLKRGGRLISHPFAVVEYNKEFFIYFHLLGNVHIKKGGEKVEKEYLTVFKETLRFVSLIKKTKNRVLEKAVPYDIRTGKIRGKYVLEKLMPEQEKKRILRDYEAHLKKRLGVPEVSLNEYLDVAAMCYQAAYSHGVTKLSPEQQYRKLADGRDGGMLSVKDRDSRKEFMAWKKTGRSIGCHPFEIVFSWHRHGINLYPPGPGTLHYSINVADYMYAGAYIEMVKSLIKREIPFQAPGLDIVLDYLSGETYFTVNGYDEHRFLYIPSREYRRLYFHHIEWDPLEVPEWHKNRQVPCRGLRQMR